MAKRLLSLLLCLCMLPVLLPAARAEAADNAVKGGIGEEVLIDAELPEHSENAEPYLALFVEYEKSSEYCTTHAKATMRYINSNGKSDNSVAKDIVIELEAEDTLEIAEGSNRIFYYSELACGGEFTFEFDLFCQFPTEYVETIPEPRLTITARSANVGGCEYTCLFDSTTEPRALLWGWDCGNKTENAIRNDLAMMDELFGDSYYNMQPVDTYYSYEDSDIWVLVQSLSTLETDENDITYVYINAHGATYGKDYRIIPGFFAYCPGTSVSVDDKVLKNKDIVLYNQLFANLAQRLKGRVVFILDICFSGMALSRAEKAGFGADDYAIITSVNAVDTAGAYDNWLTDDYGWFTKELHDEFADLADVQYVEDVYNYMSNYADTHVTFNHMDPQVGGNTALPLFCLDATAWIDDPELVIVEEHLECNPQLEMFYKYLREVVVPEIGLVPYEASKGPQSYGEAFWAGVIEQTGGLLSAAVNDFDFDGTNEMLTVSIPKRTEGEIVSEDKYMSFDLTLYQIIDGVVQPTDVWEDALSMNEKNALNEDNMRVRLVEWNDRTYVFTSAFFTSGNSYDGSDSGFCIIKDGKFVESGFLPVGQFDFFTEDGAPYQTYNKDLDDVYASKEELKAKNPGDIIATWNFDYFERYYSPELDRYTFTDLYIGRADDYTDLLPILNGEKEPKLFDTFTLTATPVPTASPEELSVDAMRKARKEAVAAAIDAIDPDPDFEAGRYYASISDSRDTGAISQILVFGPDSGDSAVLMKKFIAAISVPEVGLDADVIIALSNFDYKNEWSLVYNGFDLSYGDTPGGERVFNLIWPD
ncbi:MAG: hypothetical protein E7320_05715 [Clostridiales bacterium]|nr:hypothetical protein [Clostridiales bacterium]